MANKSEGWGGCLIMGLGGLALCWWATAPSSDQVCRDHKTPIFDTWHGVDGQPTCQQLLDQLDAQAAQARDKESELESRLSEIESKLNM